jgi:hypothetical protein
MTINKRKDRCRSYLALPAHLRSNAAAKYQKFCWKLHCCMDGIDDLVWEVLDVNLPLNNQLAKGGFANFTPLLCCWEDQWWHWGEEKRMILLCEEEEGERWHVAFCLFFLWCSCLFFFWSRTHVEKTCLSTQNFMFLELGKVLPSVNLAGVTVGIPRTKFSGCQIRTWQKVAKFELGSQVLTWHKLGMIKCHSCGRSYSAYMQKTNSLLLVLPNTQLLA